MYISTTTARQKPGGGECLAEQGTHSAEMELAFLAHSAPPQAEAVVVRLTEVSTAQGFLDKSSLDQFSDRSTCRARREPVLDHLCLGKQKIPVSSTFEDHASIQRSCRVTQLLEPRRQEQRLPHHGEAFFDTVLICGHPRAHLFSRWFGFFGHF